jgi:hypothetical protein
MKQLTAKLKVQMENANSIDEAIKANMKKIGFEI